MVVVLVFPVGDHDPVPGQGSERRDVEAFVAQLAVERLNVAVTPSLAAWDERQATVTRSPTHSRSVAQTKSEPLSLRNTTG